jgi:hypothetical protein
VPELSAATAAQPTRFLIACVDRPAPDREVVRHAVDERHLLQHALAWYAPDLPADRRHSLLADFLHVVDDCQYLTAER